MEIYNTFLIIISTITLVGGLFMSQKIILINANQRKSNNLQLIITFLLMTALLVVSGIRDVSVGADTRNYVYRYELLGKADWKNLFSISSEYSFEYGFSIFCKLLYGISNDYRLFLGFTAFWTGILFYLVIKKYSKFPLLSVLIYYCWGLWGSSMNIIREMMIIPLLYIALEKAKEKEIGKFITIVLASSLFHTIALVFLPIYFLVNIKINRKILTIAIVAAVVMGIGGSTILGTLLRWTSFGWYFETARSTSGLSTLMLTIVILLISYFFQRKLVEIDDNANIWTLFIMIAMISTAVGLSVGIFERVTKVFITSILFLFPDFVFLAKKYKAGYIALVVLVALLTYYFLGVLMVSPISSSRIIPYMTWLQ